METLIATIALFALVMGGMAIGVIFSNRALKGSCGGTGQDCLCDAQKRARCAARAGGGS